MATGRFPRDPVVAVSDAVHTVRTDNGIQFTERACDRSAFHHVFDRVCDEHGIEHRLTKMKLPWANGQVERMNRTIKDATVSASTTTARNSGDTLPISLAPTTSGDD